MAIPEPERHSDPAETRHPIDCEGGWILCWACLGDGYHDLYEEDPIFYQEGEVQICDECNGAGGWPCGVCGEDD